MAFTYTNKGRQLGNQDDVNFSDPGNYTMVLYSARETSPETLADITECTGTGYAAIEMTPVASTDANPSVASFAAVSFVFTGSEATILGFAIKRDTTLIGWEDFDTPGSMPATGGTVRVQFTQNRA